MTNLRAHHLYSLAFPSSRRIKKLKLKLLGYKLVREFADHLMDITEGIRTGTIKQVTIVDTCDVICEKCTKRGDPKCRVAGIKWSKNFLTEMDRMIAKSSGGLIEIGKTYDSEYLVRNVGRIRWTLAKAIFRLPKVLTLRMISGKKNS